MDKNKMTRKNPSVNFVSRTALNNGISDYVDKIKDIEILETYIDGESVYKK